MVMLAHAVTAGQFVHCQYQWCSGKFGNGGTLGIPSLQFPYPILTSLLLEVGPLTSSERVGEAL